MSDSPREKVNLKAYKRELNKLKHDLYWLREILTIKFRRFDDRFALLVQRIIQSFEELEGDIIDAMKKCEGYVGDVRKEITDAYLHHAEVINKLRNDMEKYTDGSITSLGVALHSEIVHRMDELRNRFAKLENQTETRLCLFGAQIADSQQETGGQVAVLMARIESLENSQRKFTVAFGLFALASVALWYIRK